jgi:heterodisulfide reductase subunit A
MCVEKCQREAVNHLMQPVTSEITAGAVVIATGFDKFNPSALDEYGYRKFDNVITSGEFERILSASGPFEGHLKRPSDLREPKKIAWIQCVGSRQARKQGNIYCSSVCCMYSIKEAVIAKEHTPGVDCHIYYMDIRAFGKDFDKYYERARDEYGVKFRRERVSLIDQVPGSDDLVLKYLDANGEVREEIYDLVVLSTGLIASGAGRLFADIAGLNLNRYGFIGADRFFREQTGKEGIYLCGTALAPRDIPETVASASAAAACASAFLREARNTLSVKKEYPPETDISGTEPRVGVFVCHCGINIGAVVDVPAVVAQTRKLPGVVYAEDNLYTCSQDTQEKIKALIKEHKLNRILVASCTPRTHESLFQNTLREAGLNPFLFEFIGIREQCSWVHIKDKKAATEKALDLVAMGVARARLLMPFQRTSFPVLKKGLVIGGGISGLAAATSLAGQGFEVFLVEKEKDLGGNLRRAHYTLEGDDVQAMLSAMVARVKSNPAIKVFTDSELKDFSGYVGNYKSVIADRSMNREEIIEHGVIIVATGAREADTQEYLSGKSEKIISQRLLDERLAGGEKFNDVTMIQCVGSREKERPYCSRVCCQEAIKNALRIKTLNPDARVTVFYRDIRTYGFSEEYYPQARAAGVNFIRYDPDQDKPAVALDQEGFPVISYQNILLGRKDRLKTDLLVLSTGMDPQENKHLSSMLKVPLNKEGFFLEAHAKLRPLDFPAEGIYLCGTAHSPKTIAESLTQAAGAAARAVTLLSKDEIQSRGLTVQIKDRICSGCGVCVQACPFDAREIDPETGKARIIEVLCQGCGACATACPNAATQQMGFAKHQVYQMVEELV